MTWHFREKRTGDDFSDPISGEFFADGSTDNPATALVAESLQNALDAGRKIDRNGDPVRVRIALRRGDYAMPGDTASKWFADVWHHLTSDGSGIKNVPDPSEPCDLLIVEDFGTCGLTGEIKSDDTTSAGNNFVDFMRSDGRTHKSAGDRGSWGVGKIVFPRSSRINGFLAYTVREDDSQRLAMGKVILKNRRLHDHQYQPPCYYGKSWDNEGVPLPIDDAEHISQMQEAFDITREDQPGLSIVVPWLDPGIEFEFLLRAVVEKYAYAILAGQLAVTLDDGSTTIDLDADSLEQHTAELSEEDAASVRLIAWSLGVQEADHLALVAPPADEKQKWTPGLLPESMRQQIKEALAERKPVAVRFPLHVPKSGSKETAPSYFDVYLEHHEGGSLRPRFIRECLAISGVKGLSATARIRSLVVIGSGHLADVLGAAEPPSHNDWAADTANFQRQYKGSTHILTYVKKCVQNLIAAVRAGEEKPDPTVTMDFFAVTEHDEKTPAKKKKKTKKPGDKTKEPDLDIQSNLARVTISDVKGGFVVRPGHPDADRYDVLDIRMAYDVFNKSPWSQYEPADFDLTRNGRSGIEIVAGGSAAFEVRGPNRIRLTFTGDDYEVYVTGFDTNRDLKVKKVEVTLSAEPDAEAAEEEPAVAQL
ncbi:hypothetical protein OT109_14005 [Phycisphaeraceae bacterium D3-23]